MGKKIRILFKNIVTRLRLLIILTVTSQLFSCHSEYLSLDYSIHHGGCISADSSFAVFVLTTKAFRHATGVSRFPDGGIPDYIISDMAIYYLDMNERSLEKIVELKDFASFVGSSRSLWKTYLNISRDSVMYQVQPVTDWEKYEKWKEIFQKVYVYNISSKEITESSDLTEVTCPESQKLSIMDISRILKEMPLSEIGFVLKDIFPKPDQEYIDETIYRKNNSELIRRAVVEQIISKMSKDEIAGLLKKMDEYKNSLEGLERTEYELYSKDVYERIKDLIRTWTDIIFYDVTSFDQIVFIKLPEQEKVTVNMFPGKAKSKEEFIKHSRPKQIRVTILSGIHAEGFVSETATLYKGLKFNDPVIIELEDSYGIQSFEIDLPLKEIENLTGKAEKKFTQEFGLAAADKCIALKIEVTDVYPGSESQHICISEVFTGDIYESDPEVDLKISDVFVNDTENAILAEVDGGKEIEIFSDPSSVLQLIEVSSNKKWAVVISMPAEIDGRSETKYLLIDITKGETINVKIGALSGGIMYFEKPWAGLETLIYSSKDGRETKVYLK